MAFHLDRSALTSSAALQSPDTETWSASALETLPWQPKIRPSEWTKESLAPYRRFTKLCGERKYAKKYPAQPFRLLALPPEIRTHVYRAMLVLDSPIELAPKSTGFRKYVHSKNDWLDAIHEKRYRYSIMPKLRLLCTSKQVHREASSIFYGENEFRFTSMEGWQYLSSFILTIGLENTCLFRSIAVHTPWFGMAKDDDREGGDESLTKLNVLRSEAQSRGLRCHPRQWQFRQSGYVRFVKKVLESTGGLEYLKIIIADSYMLVPWYAQGSAQGSIPMVEIFDPFKIPKLEVTMVRLHGGFCSPDTDQQERNARRRACLQTHVEAWDWFTANCGWKLETAVLGHDGRYPAPLKEGDVILERLESGDIESLP